MIFRTNYIYGRVQEEKKIWKTLESLFDGREKVLNALKEKLFPVKVMDVNAHEKTFFNWDSPHARLNSHYKAWSCKENKHKKVKAYRKSLYKEPAVNRCLLILDFNTSLDLNTSDLDYRSKESTL